MSLSAENAEERLTNVKKAVKIASLSEAEKGAVAHAEAQREFPEAEKETAEHEGEQRARSRNVKLAAYERLSCGSH